MCSAIPKNGESQLLNKRDRLTTLRDSSEASLSIFGFINQRQLFELPEFFRLVNRGTPTPKKEAKLLLKEVTI